MVKEVFQIIRDIKTAGTTLLLVEQNARMALREADRGYVLENGSVVLQESAAELLNSRLVQEAYLGA
jgi:branched-chain amino acid transport system ATP-binding protein